MTVFRTEFWLFLSAQKDVYKRQHQIRVQLAHLGTPICGDHKYGKAERGTPALCSYHIDFVHPVSGKEMTYEISPRNFETEC